MKVAMGQFAVSREWQENTDICIGLMNQALAGGADLLVLPEGVLARDIADPDLVLKAAQPLDGPFVTQLLAVSKGNNLTTMMSVHVPTEGQKALNVLIHPGNIQLASLLTGLSALAILLVLARTRLSVVSALIALVIPTVVVVLAGARLWPGSGIRATSRAASRCRISPTSGSFRSAWSPARWRWPSSSSSRAPGSPKPYPTQALRSRIRTRTSSRKAPVTWPRVSSVASGWAARSGVPR